LSSGNGRGNGMGPGGAQGGGKWEPACKPGSVGDRHSSGTPVTRRLEQPTRVRCGPHHGTPIWPCSGRGLPCHALLPGARCALTAPFHPYLWTERCRPHRRYLFCGTFRRLAPPRNYLASCPAEPGLSSTLARSDDPADSHLSFYAPQGPDATGGGAPVAGATTPCRRKRVRGHGRTGGCARHR